MILGGMNLNVYTGMARHSHPVHPCRTADTNVPGASIVPVARNAVKSLSALNSRFYSKQYQRSKKHRLLTALQGAIQKTIGAGASTDDYSHSNTSFLEKSQKLQKYRLNHSLKRRSRALHAHRKTYARGKLQRLFRQLQTGRVLVRFRRTAWLRQLTSPIRAQVWVPLKEIRTRIQLKVSLKTHLKWQFRWQLKKVALKRMLARKLGFFLDLFSSAGAYKQYAQHTRYFIKFNQAKQNLKHQDSNYYHK